MSRMQTYKTWIFNLCMQFTRGLSLERQQFAIKVFTHLAAAPTHRASREQERRKEEGTADSCVSLIKALEVH